MTIQGRRFPRPWRKVGTPQGFLVVDGEGKKITHVVGHENPPTFGDLGLPEAGAIADAIVRIPQLLDLEAEKRTAQPLEPLIALAELNDGQFVILRDCHGVLQRSRPFETKEAAIYACSVWYGAEPAMPVTKEPTLPGENPAATDDPTPDEATH